MYLVWQQVLVINRHPAWNFIDTKVGGHDRTIRFHGTHFTLSSFARLAWFSWSHDLTWCCYRSPLIPISTLVKELAVTMIAKKSTIPFSRIRSSEWVFGSNTVVRCWIMRQNSSPSPPLILTTTFSLPFSTTSLFFSFLYFLIPAPSLVPQLLFLLSFLLRCIFFHS